jgi:hypothetical protein
MVKRALENAYGSPMAELYDRLYHRRKFAYTLEQLNTRKAIV